MGWQEHLREMDEILAHMKENNNLRHDLHAVGPSTIGRQYFCEQKVNLRQQYGEIQTEEKKIGKEIHKAQLIGTEQISLEDLITDIESKKVLISQEFALAAKIKGLPMIGRIDSILFLSGKPRLVAELKNTSTHTRIYKNHLIQAKMYGLLLDAVGFDCSELSLFIASQHVKTRKMFPPKGFYPKDLNRTFGTLILNREVTRTCKREYYYRKIYPFKRSKALEELEWASKYWKKERKPVATRNKNKCKACEYEDCPRKSDTAYV